MQANPHESVSPEHVCVEIQSQVLGTVYVYESSASHRLNKQQHGYLRHANDVTLLYQVANKIVL